MITAPKIRLYGAGDLNRLVPFEFKGQVAEEIGRYGEPLKDIHKGSISLRDEATLFQAYLLSELGEYAPPEEIQGVIKHLFERTGYGNVTDNACDYDNGNKGLKKVKKTDRRVRWIPHPERFERTEDGWKAAIGEDGFVHILVPESGYVEMTCDGLYRPDTGTPYSTTNNRAKSEKSLTDRGFSPEFAKLAVSYFYSREEGKGTAAVVRWFSKADDGRFDVSADYDPDYGFPDIGSFPASRSAERSEAGPEERGIKVLTLERYGELARDSEILEAVRKTLNE
jgi:hypothetical protein